MNAADIKPVLILLTSLFILFMLSGCVVAPYPERAVVVRPAPAHYYHPGAVLAPAVVSMRNAACYLL